ncbi:MAG: phage regulatory CII family protein [Alphaproteobacteria bacterium]
MANDKDTRIHSFFARDYGSVKAAVAALIGAAGGEKAAAEKCRVGKSMLSDYANPNHEKTHMPVDVVMALEAETGQMAVTEHLASAHGCLLLKLPDADFDHDWTLHLARIGKESGDVFASCQEFLSDDMDIDDKEAPPLLKEIDELLAAVAEMRGAVASRLKD